MLSIKISGSHLEAIRETERMLVKIDEYCSTRHSKLSHATVSGNIIGRVANSNRRTLQTKGVVANGRIIINVRTIIELVIEKNVWFPVKGNLLLGEEHYEFKYIGGRSFFERSYRNHFPS